MIPATSPEFLNRALNDFNFRADLAEHGLKQANEFSWAETARRAWDAISASAAEEVNSPPQTHKIAPGLKPRLAFVSPLPPERSGIADYAVELLPELSRYYDIDVVVDQNSVEDPWTQANCRIRSWRWFDENAYLYDRICYQFGNSQFHLHMLELLRKHPGVVDLHDFYLSGLFFELEHRQGPDGLFLRELYLAHGYSAALWDAKGGDRGATMWRYPINNVVIQNASALIVHSKHALCLLDQSQSQRTEHKWSVIPHPARAFLATDRASARARLGIEPEFVHRGRVWHRCANETE